MLKNLLKFNKVFLALLIFLFCYAHFSYAQSSVQDNVTLNAVVEGTSTSGGGDGGSGGSGGGIKVGTPIATPDPSFGPFTSIQSVTLSSATSTSIHYTTDGSTPDCSSGIIYSGAITVASSETINAIGCNGSYFSSVATFDYVINIPVIIVVGDPVATPVSGTYTATTTVTLTSASSTSIMYTIDGTDPACPSTGGGGYGTTYSTGIVVDSSETIKAIGCNGIYVSDISIFNYVINLPIIPPTVYAPQASLPSGTYSGSQNVSLSSLNSTSIHYTTDGSTPDCSGTFDIYSSEIFVVSSETIKAIGCNGTSFSSISIFNYVINPIITIITATTTLGNGSLPATTTTSTNSATTTLTTIINKTLTTIATTTTQQITNVINVTKTGITNVSHIVTKTVASVQKVFTAPANVVKVQAITTVSVVAGTAVSAISGILLSTFSFADLALLPLRLWALILGLLGLSKRKKPWGTVYDSVTKQPLDPVYVVLRSIEGTDVATAITDLDGRYGFVVPNPGSYSIVVNKTNYQFPSQNLVGRDHDELYRDLYFGEHFSILNSGDIIAKNIPMDPEKFDWNEFAKKSQHLMKFYSSREKWFSRISAFFFYIGFIVSSLAVLFLATRGNILIFLLYVGLFFLRVFGLKGRPYGSIVSSETGSPIAFAIIRISQVSTGVEIMHRITDSIGRYYCLLPNGTYNVRVDQKLTDGTYEKIAEKISVTVTKGYLSNKIMVKNLPLDSVTGLAIKKSTEKDGIKK